MQLAFKKGYSHQSIEDKLKGGEIYEKKTYYGAIAI